MNIVIETKRLLPRTFTALNANLIYELNLDPDVTRYSHDSVKDLGHTSEILENVIMPNMLFIIMAAGRCT